MISVIIPIYKTSPELLVRCIASIQQQDVSDYEVIMIDDGSCQPKLTAVLKNYLSDKRFILLEQENQGVSATRNRGISSAGGEYITFVDADDTLAPSFFRRALEIMQKTDADAVIGGIYMYEGEKKNICTISSDKVLTFEGSQVKTVQDYMLSMSSAGENKVLSGLRLRGPWGKLIRKKALTGITFQTNLPVYEDTVFNVRLFQNMQKIAVDYEIYYHYYIAEGSAMRRFRPNGIQEQLVLASELNQISKEIPALQPACGVFMLTGIKKLIHCTLYHQETKTGSSYPALKHFLTDASVCILLDSVTGTHQKHLSLKDSVFLFMCRHCILLLHILVSSGVI
ncbi:MAG: glycosyltransferase family 2 protein [Oscillospiraceae bacterium]|nr:glycosyltransferase family 2 protein [Oscillospiraceae bacterium]